MYNTFGILALLCVICFELLRGTRYAKPSFRKKWLIKIERFLGFIFFSEGKPIKDLDGNEDRPFPPPVRLLADGADPYLKKPVPPPPTRFREGHMPVGFGESDIYGWKSRRDK